MQDNWESFPCQIGDHRAVISFNASFAQRADDAPIFQNFAGFRVALNAPTEEGLPADPEFGALNALEDQLCQRIQLEGGVQVGRATYAGHRDFAFYTDMTQAQCFALIDSLRNDAQHAITLCHEHDPSQRHYWRAFYPTLEDWQVIKDIRMEEVLRERGDPLTQERAITHWALFPNVAARSAFLAHLPGAVSVQELSESSDRPEHPFIVRLTHTGKPEHRALNPITVGMTRMAHQAGGIYDGWETALCLAT